MQKDKNKSIRDKVSELESSIIYAALQENGLKESIKKYNLSYSHKRKLSGRLDPENITSKWITDALVTSKILLDDGYQNIPQGVQIKAPCNVESILEEEIEIYIEIL